MKKSNLKKLTVTAILAAVAVVGSLFSFPVFGSKCAPVQHLVNILCAVTVGPWWALAQAFIASLIRNLLGLGSPLAFPGSMCGALLGGLLYKYGKKLPFAYIGEVVGTGILGGMLSYPVAYLVMGNTAATLFMFVVPFLISTCGGTIIAIIITLPFAPDAEGTFSVDTQPDIQQKDVKEEKEKTINILEGLRIMVVDDNDMNREFVGELLEEQGAIVDLAPGGRESVEMFCQSEEFAYNVILMDIMMPEVDGCEAARLIRSQQRADAETVIILALTANSFAEDVIRTMESGMNAHLVKPINMKILQETVQKLLEKKNEG